MSTDSGAQLRRAALGHDWPPRLPARLSPFEGVYRAVLEGVAADLGGAENMATTQRVLAWALADATVQLARAARNVAARGLCRRDGELRGPAKFYWTGQNTVRLHALALGLSRRARNVGSYVEEAKARGLVRERP